jgi:AbiV family abortive infection protein
MATRKHRRNKRLHKGKAVNPLSIPQILSATSKILENAQELIEDAELLLENNRYPRAFVLAHLASEELIKYHAFFPVVLELARDHRVDWKTIDRLLRDHQAKIRGTILFDFVLEPPSDGVYQANKLSQRMRAVQDTNDLKNYGLYASQIDHEYFKPSDLINDQAARECVSHARGRLQWYRMFHSVFSELTGMTEEGLRRCIAMPEFQWLFQTIGDKTDLSHISTVGTDEIVAFFNTTFQAMFAQFGEQDLRSPNQSNSDDPLVMDAPAPESELARESGPS